MRRPLIDRRATSVLQQARGKGQRHRGATYGGLLVAASALLELLLLILPTVLVLVIALVIIAAWLAGCLRSTSLCFVGTDGRVVG